MKILDRRTFLRVGGGGALALAGNQLFGQTGHGQPGATVPVKPVVLKSAQLELVLDRNSGVPLEYRLIGAEARIHGDVQDSYLAATMCDTRAWSFTPVPIHAKSVAETAAQADFHFTAVSGSRPAADFTIRYAVQNATVFVTLHDVHEYPGFELIDVAMPDLVTVREDDEGAWLAHGDSGGSVAMLSAATPASLAPNRFWGKTLATLPIVMAGHAKATCVLEVTAFMDGTEMRVSGEPGKRRGTLGTIQAHRINGSQCFDMNTGNDKTTKNCGTRTTPNLLIEQPSACRLDFLPATQSEKPAWLAAAQVVRQRMPPIPKHLYDGAFVYGILCDQPLFEKPSATFADCERIIREISSLTDNARQIVHLWGWQSRGKDSGYPAVNEVNARIGGYEGMMRLMRSARDFNCTVTLSDNYDDAYRSSPSWNADWIARRPDGELWESRNWTGENSYILGMAKYVPAAGLERVRYTCERYKLPETTHVDVLSYYSIRNDWDRAHPASGIKNLQARYAVLEEFAKHGVDVSSEALRYAFLGKISSFWYMTGPSPCPFGGQPIPLLATIYRKSAVWGQSGRMADLAEGMFKMLFYNGYAHASFRGAADLKATTDLFYLMMVPWFHLHARNIEGFRRDGDRVTISLEGNAIITLDSVKHTYAVSLDGVEIARDLATFCPLDNDRIAFYAATAKELSLPMPKGWNAAKIAAFTMSANDRKETKVAVKEGAITIAVEPQQPVIVYRDADKIMQAPS